MGSSSSSHDSQSRSHSSSWFHSDSCDVGGYAHDVGTNALLGAGAGALSGMATGPGAGAGALGGALYEGLTTLAHKYDECSHR
ncbi:hypothetical protein [Bartonella senegalensis]|uniref:hypothetical protein n=1 Tax=Bartonella senegalensis TaxID=1468418 RepID=UPI0002FF6D1B|nr:hypothetical protein [Bartonella senegalensis]